MSHVKDKQVYERFISDYLEHIQESCAFCETEEQIITYAKTHIPEFVEALSVKKALQLHDYLMCITETRKDNRIPIYVYSGGDRIISVTRYLQKYIDLELAKQYA